MDKFSAGLEEALASKQPVTIINSKTFRSFAVIVAMFRLAEREILLLSHELDRTFYGVRALRFAVEEFLSERKGLIRVLVERRMDEDHPLLEIAARYPDRFRILRIPREWQDYDCNFMVMDCNGLRYVRNRNSVSTYASFYCDGATELAALMRDRFEALASKSVPLERTELDF